MALLTGVRRIKLLGLIVAVSGPLIAFALLAGVPLYVHVPLVWLIWIPLFLGAVIFAFGWLIEGFVRPDANRQ
jgi:hypothetical protein